MSITSIITVISLITSGANGLGMVLMYLRYIRVIRGAFVVTRATPDGEVEIVDLLPDSLKAFPR